MFKHPNLSSKTQEKFCQQPIIEYNYINSSNSKKKSKYVNKSKLIYKNQGNNNFQKGNFNEENKQREIKPKFESFRSIYENLDNFIIEDEFSSLTKEIDSFINFTCQENLNKNEEEKSQNLKKNNNKTNPTTTEEAYPKNFCLDHPFDSKPNDYNLNLDDINIWRKNKIIPLPIIKKKLEENQENLNSQFRNKFEITEKLVKTKSKNSSQEFDTENFQLNLSSDDLNFPTPKFSPFEIFKTTAKQSENNNDYPYEDLFYHNLFSSNSENFKNNNLNDSILSTNETLCETPISPSPGQDSQNISPNDSNIRRISCNKNLFDNNDLNNYKICHINSFCTTSVNDSTDHFLNLKNNNNKLNFNENYLNNSQINSFNTCLNLNNNTDLNYNVSSYNGNSLIFNNQNNIIYNSQNFPQFNYLKNNQNFSNENFNNNYLQNSKLKKVQDPFAFLREQNFLIRNANKMIPFEEPHNRINLENILKGKDKRTTLMIRHIPNKYTLQTILEDINLEFKNKYDVFYLPLDFNNNCNLGFAFINFIDPFHILFFFDYFRGKKWRRFNSEKICELAYAKFQGKKELINHFEKGSVMNFDSEDKKPLILPTPNPPPKIELPIVNILFKILIV